MLNPNSKLAKSFTILFNTLFEEEFKGLSPYMLNWYTANRIQYRIYLLLEILEYNKIITQRANYFKFSIKQTVNKTYKLHSEELSDFLNKYLSEERQPSLSKEAKQVVTEVNKLTRPHIKDKEYPGIDPVLNGACLLIYKMSQYGFPESHYIMDATKEIFYSNQNYPLMWEILQKTQDILKHPAFMDLQYKFDHFTAEVKHDVSVKMKEETIFLNNIDNL